MRALNKHNATYEDCAFNIKNHEELVFTLGRLYKLYGNDLTRRGVSMLQLYEDITRHWFKPYVGSYKNYRDFVEGSFRWPRKRLREYKNITDKLRQYENSMQKELSR